ncbi:aminodeoxychorismate synthase component I [Acidicapsa acidisoli]|uniref:aminodeoxychorismate synthase component I n=1 Tax=Acidicapsa acidisoli TaxID=1615681 RepID=UPI0021DFB7DF|nr:aminodeoxychorismate synthase component I [Acidicapsa acidisoli]
MPRVPNRRICPITLDGAPLRAPSLNPFVPLPPQCLTLAASTPGSVLLQTSRMDAENYRSYLFTRPRQILGAADSYAHKSLFVAIERALADGDWVAGFFSYEYSAQMQSRGHGDAKNSPTPLAWLGVFAKPFVFNHRSGQFEGDAPTDFASDEGSPPEANYEISDLRWSLSSEDYAWEIAAIHEYIRAGDTYQVNFTHKLHFDFSGSAAALFRAVTACQPVPYSAFLHAEDWKILSFSPELFFRRKGSQILTRPMKGTAPRGADCAEDEAMAAWLQNNGKNRSENVMIVDLLRNDLGRICEFGSVDARRLFSIEKYETLFQMTSEISGTLRADVSNDEIFRSLFPCGSITGAPKLRTMEIIRELEVEPRGVYTGAIGFFSPHSEAVFSVPIRTVLLTGSRGEMGVGSGIVIDSQANEEYRECRLKSRFLTGSVKREAENEPFQLIESILWQDGYCRLSMHIERLELSARYFGFRFDQTAILASLEAVECDLTPGQRTKVRLTLDRDGAMQITHAAAAENMPGKVVVSAHRVRSSDRLLRHKTTRRRLFDEQYQWAAALGFVDVLFLNERDEVTQGAISNLFVVKNGQWFTPPVSCGVLPGVYRRHLLEARPDATEKVLHLADLASADAVYLCNAIRGCTEVTAIEGIRSETQAV